MISDIEGFFHEYASAAEALGVHALASFHHAPFLHIRGDGRVECLSTQEAVSKFFELLTGKYAGRDHGGGRFLDLEITPLGSAAALASLTWEQFRADGSVYRRFRRSYNLIRVGAEWKIVVAGTRDLGAAGDLRLAFSCYSFSDWLRSTERITSCRMKPKTRCSWS
jgi:hypothetical protein